MCVCVELQNSTRTALPRQSRLDDGAQRPEDLDDRQPHPAATRGQELHEHRVRHRHAAQPETHEAPREEKEPERRAERRHLGLPLFTTLFCSQNTT